MKDVSTKQLKKELAAREKTAMQPVAAEIAQKVKGLVDGEIKPEHLGGHCAGSPPEWSGTMFSWNEKKAGVARQVLEKKWTIWIDFCEGIDTTSVSGGVISEARLKAYETSISIDGIQSKMAKPLEDAIRAQQYKKPFELTIEVGRGGKRRLIGPDGKEPR